MADVEHDAARLDSPAHDSSASTAIATPPSSREDGASASPSKKPEEGGQGVPAPTDLDGGEKLDEKDPNLVEWEGPDDPANPHNWSLAKKWVSMVVVSTSSFCVTLNSSIVTSTFDAISTEFHIGREVAILGLSLFVVGLGVGPLLLGPASELYGRKPIYIVALTLFWLFQFPVAFANK